MTETRGEQRVYLLASGRYLVVAGGKTCVTVDWTDAVHYFERWAVDGFYEEFDNRILGASAPLRLTASTSSWTLRQQVEVNPLWRTELS